MDYLKRLTYNLVLLSFIGFVLFYFFSDLMMGILHINWLSLGPFMFVMAIVKALPKR